jgi:hypothetical protein
METTARRLQVPGRAHVKMFRLPTTVLTVVLCCFWHAALSAAPLTLQFEATVGPPLQGFDGIVPPSWNVSLNPGDTVIGTFTFEPLNAPTTTAHTVLVEPYDFALQINSRRLTTSQYGIEVYNDIFNDEQGFRDQIFVGCSAGVAGAVCMPATISTEPLTWSFELFLSGNSSVLDGADIPTDPSIWQQLVYFESFDAIFIDNNAGRSYGFIATPQSFQLVPEPISCLYVFVGAPLLGVVTRLFYRR